jgi:hypothetical protein
MDDMAIVGKGALVRPPEEKLTDKALLLEIDDLMQTLLGFDARTKIIDSQYQGDQLYSAACQKFRCDVGGRDVTLLVGLERKFLRYATVTLWPGKNPDREMDKAHELLVRWCLTAFVVAFWRTMVARFTFDKPCVLKEIYPLAAKDIRHLIRKMNYTRSTLYETTKGRFFVTSEYNI